MKQMHTLLFGMLASIILVMNITASAISAYALASPQANEQVQHLSSPSTAECPNFTDVTLFDYFCTDLTAMVNGNAISGYTSSPPCVTGTPCFLPYNSVTRGQFTKMLINRFGSTYSIPPNQQTFTDVPPSSPFWSYIEIAAHQNPVIVSGYTGTDCTNNGVGSPCFLPNNPVTRGQMIKMTSNAAGFIDSGPSTPTFFDVSSSDTYFIYIERAVKHNTLSQYPPDASPHPICGSATQPCFFPMWSALRADAAIHIQTAYRFRVNQSGTPFGQVFAQKQGYYDIVQANITTPLESSSLVSANDFIAAPLALTSRWNPIYIEVGPEERRVSSNIWSYHPYYHWNNAQGGTGYHAETGINLTPGAASTYQLSGIPGDEWRAYYCPTSTCQQLAIANSLFNTPFATAGAETSEYTITTGPITVSYFTLRLVGGSPFTSCYDPALVPWKMFKSTLGTCNSSNASWTMAYTPPSPPADNITK